jgi:hypothetical protein
VYSSEWGSVVYTAKLRSNYFSHIIPKKENQNTHYRNKLMLKPLPPEGTEPAVKVVTQHEHRNYQ